MRSATELLVQYAAYHRDRRNIASHLVGVPMIVFAVGVLLARPAIPLGVVSLTPGWIAFLLAAGWYLTRGNLVLGTAVSAVVGFLILPWMTLMYVAVAPGGIDGLTTRGGITRIGFPA